MSDELDPHDPAEAPTLGMDEPARLHADVPVGEIGGYRILGRLGEGGMGIVYEAEQKSPQRRVALKVVRGGPFVDELHLRMFRHETETLARLAHPNIAAIYEAGRTAEGQHFFTMELVAGRTLNAYLRDHLGGDQPTIVQIRERLRLFATIARAVNYAHQRGVIHRDLKPTNVLVSESGDVKVLDFGLARIVDADASATLAREVGTIRGTLAYMSPEMARGGDVDVRSDVYALGIMFYEMLAGRAPYETTTSSVVQAIRTICEQPPRVLQTTAGGLPIDSDLRTISAKALAKEPGERYQSAGALADDVDRWLANEPILAHPPSAAYQLRKYVARHRGQVAALSAIATLLVALVVTMVVQARHVRIERDRATAAAAKAEAINHFLLDALGSADPWSRGSRTVTLMDALHQSERNVHAAFAKQPLVEAAVLRTLGSTFGSLAEYADADTALRASLAIRERETGPRSAETADALSELASLYIHWERFPEAEKFAREALDIEREVHGRASFHVLAALNNLASIDTKIAKFSEAKALAEEELKIVNGPRPADPEATREEWAKAESYALTILAEVALSEGDGATMEKLDHRRLAIFREVAPDDGADLASTLNDLATAQMTNGELAAAESTYAEAITIGSRTFGEDHPAIAIFRENLGNVHFRQGKLDLTARDLAAVLAIRRRALGDDSEPVGRTLTNLAAVYRKAGRYALSESTYRESIPKLRAKLGPDHPDVAIAMVGFGDVLRRQSEFVEAESTLRHALAVLAKTFGDQNAMTQNALKACAELYTDWKKPAEAAGYTARLVAKK